MPAKDAILVNIHEPGALEGRHEQWPVLAARVQKVADELSVRLHGRPAK